MKDTSSGILNRFLNPDSNSDLNPIIMHSPCLAITSRFFDIMNNAGFIIKLGLRTWTVIAYNIGTIHRGLRDPIPNCFWIQPTVNARVGATNESLTIPYGCNNFSYSVTVGQKMQHNFCGCIIARKPSRWVTCGSKETVRMDIVTSLILKKLMVRPRVMMAPIAIGPGVSWCGTHKELELWKKRCKSEGRLENNFAPQINLPTSISSSVITRASFGGNSP